ncbi:hypothetical protein BS47DRAFT_1344535 [Hydnum rufescens UP504]|uniref:Flavin-containing monooxygenase n=1 Tax=Hydnum rufescens UP504 TaxID=1448309 RepID=A0A9P6DTF4_9AGAM|nr:hypothetical protein BS47DRAFT_1344535 [Hydnum rufescens UP504]
MPEDQGENVVYPGHDGPVPPTPLYNSLTTNLPHPLMAFHDFLFPPSTSLFPPASHVLTYLRAYADRFDLRPHIRFRTRVESLHWNAAISKWELDATEVDKGNRPIKGLYDAIIISNGNYGEPRLPEIPGIVEWEAAGRKLMHSIWYREPSPFRDLRVLVVGGGPSGLDISEEISHTARLVYHSTTGANRTEEGAILMRGRVIALRPDDNRVDYEDGTWDTGIDHIVFATGYKFFFPAMLHLGQDPTPPLDRHLPDHLFNSTSHVYPLARHVFPLRDYSPQTLAFVGLVSQLAPFPAWEDQAQAVATVFLDGDDKFDRAAEVSRVSARYDILRRRAGSKPSYIAQQWHRFREDDEELESQFQHRTDLLALAGKKGWEVQSWEPHVYRNRRVLRAEWVKLERSGIADDWVRGVGENGLGEWLDLMDKVLENAREHQV